MTLMKPEELCNAAGANLITGPDGRRILAPVSEWRRCVGEGGLAFGDDDLIATGGCPNSNNNNFLAPLRLEEDSVIYTGQSSFFIFGEEAISEYEWFFGSGAEPSTATGIGPHDVFYTTPGEKNVSLTLESSRFSCKAEELIDAIVDIESCCDINGIVGTSESEDEVCDEENGSIDLTVESEFAYSVDWNIGSRDEQLSELDDGLYVVVAVLIDDLLPNPVIPSLTMPTCDGGVDGAIDLNIGMGNTITWANPDSLRTRLENVPVGDYAVTIVDANGCAQDLVVELRALELLIDPDISEINDPSCFGIEDGSIAFELANGIAPYTYDWEDNIAGIDENSVDDLAAGTYSVTINDVNNCIGEVEVRLMEPAKPQTSLAQGKGMVVSQPSSLEE